MEPHAVGVSSDASVTMTRETSRHCQLCLSCSYCGTWKMQESICVIETETKDTTPDILIELIAQVGSRNTVGSTGVIDNIRAAGSNNEK